MIVLGIDTSGYVNAVGIVNGSHVMADSRFPAGTDTLEQIVDNIDVTLKNAGLTLKEVDGIGVGLGPGSWTGIKVGVTVGKMLAFSAGKPVAGIPTLEAIAYNAGKESLPVYAVIGAGVKNLVYAARYHVNGSEVTRNGDYFAGDARELAGIIKERAILAGQEAARYKEIIIKENNNLKNRIEAIENEPAGASIARLAAARLLYGQSDDPLSLTPLYLKESTAKVFVNKYAGKT